MASQPKRRRVLALEKCIICQADKSDILRKAKGSSLDTLKRALELRRDEVYDRIYDELPSLANEELVWHSICYSSYTSEKNIRSAIGTHTCEDDGDEQQRRASRMSASVSVDWSKCFICRNKTYKKDKKMNKVCTFEACQNVREAADNKGDEVMIHALISVNYDLIAADAQYHKTCFASYISKSNLKHKAFREKQGESLYEEMFDKMSSEITEGLKEGMAFDMTSLLSRYRELLAERGVDATSYSKQRLKLRLEKHFGETIIFHKDPGKNRPEVIYSSDISIQDMLNSVAAARNPNSNSERDIKDQVLNLARQIKEEIRECAGISLKPLDADDVSLESAQRIVPPTLYWLVRLMVTSDRSGIDDFDNPKPCKRIEDERKTLSIAQDVIHCASNARIKLPKHIGLAMAVRQMTGSKQLVVLLNRMGHSSSYDELQAVDTCLATEVMAKAATYGTVVPTNISAGSFVQLAADNNDLSEETLDGKNTTHATTLVVYQKKIFGPELPPTTVGDHSQRRRSLKRSDKVYELQECSALGRRPQVKEYVGKVEERWFKDENAALSNLMITDELWAFLRMKPAVIFETGTNAQEVQLVPGWSAFNAILYPDLPLSTKIGYCPMIEGPSTEFSTIYTVLKHAQKLSSRLGQRDTVITFDLAIYVKAKQIQTKFPAEFSDTVIRLGGFHVALNYLALLGKMFRCSGLEDLFIESGVYAAGTANALMKGKSYNRGVRAHKLAVEAFYRLLWNAFLAWRKERSGADEATNENAVSKEIQKCRQAIIAKEAVRQGIEELQHETQALRSQFNEFVAESKGRSKMFAFWLQYRHMVQLLLQFVKAERVGDWELHLSIVSAMIPYYFAMDRQNYARWLPVYILDMKQLVSKHPEVHKEFLSGNHAVSRSTKPFAKVWTDMALEQSINADSKSKGGIVGISQNPGALDRWFLTSHERASVTSAVKDMFIGEHNAVDGHKEATPKRVARDEADVQKLISCFTSELMSNPFEREDDSLVNFATGVVLPPSDADALIKCKDKGTEQMNSFIERRLNDTTEVSFWDPIQKLQVKTFESTSKRVAVKAINEKLLTVGADRELFARLLIAANVRQVNLKEVLCYELSSVPLSLAHEDGTLRKTTKSVLSGLLEAKVVVLPRLQPFTSDTIHLIDGMALVQAMKLAGSSTFGEMAEKYFKVITAPLSHATEVHVVGFDQYWDVSIKAAERERRHEQSATLEVKIHGPMTPVPKQWTKYIPNPTNKVNLCNFLSESFCALGKQLLPPTKAVFIGGGFKDGRRAVAIRSGRCDGVHSLESDHEEADTRLLLHAKYASEAYPGCRIILQSPDTDVLILSVAHFSCLNPSEFWFKTGIKDRLRYVPVHELSQKLGVKLCRALLSYHAITGCDSTSALDKVGKKKHWPAFEKNEEHQERLGLLGTEANLSDVVVSGCESFVCDLYPFHRRKVHTTDELRYLLFCQKKSKNECLPPTSDSLLQHLKRANYQVLVWRKALTAIQALPEPAGHGWAMEEGCLKPVYMTKDPAPASLLELTTCGCKSGCETNCSCNNTGLSCSESCYCMGSNICRNPHGIAVDYSSDEDSDDE